MKHIQDCLDFAEAIRFEYGVYAALTYIQNIVSFCIIFDDPATVSILYPQCWIHLTRVAELFPSQGTSYVIPDAVQALQTLSVDHAMVSVPEGRETAIDEVGRDVHVIRTNPMALNSTPTYERLPGRHEKITHHLTLWEAKPLDVTYVLSGPLYSISLFMQPHIPQMSNLLGNDQRRSSAPLSGPHSHLTPFWESFPTHRPASSRRFSSRSFTRL